MPFEAFPRNYNRKPENSSSRISAALIQQQASTYRPTSILQQVQILAPESMIHMPFLKIPTTAASQKHSTGSAEVCSMCPFCCGPETVSRSENTVHEMLIIWVSGVRWTEPQATCNRPNPIWLWRATGNTWPKSVPNFQASQVHVPAYYVREAQGSCRPVPHVGNNVNRLLSKLF